VGKLSTDNQEQSRWIIDYFIFLVLPTTFHFGGYPILPLNVLSTFPFDKLIFLLKNLLYYHFNIINVRGPLSSQVGSRNLWTKLIIQIHTITQMRNI